MAERNNDNNNDNDDNSNNSNDSPIQQRGIITGVLDYLTTPLRTRTRTERQNLIDRQQVIRNLEEEIGLGPVLYPEEEKQDDEDHKEEEEEPEETIMATTYSLGGMSLEFNVDEPVQNADYEVGVMISKANRPDHGSDLERRLIEGICKNQYGKYKRAETSMKSIERLLQSRSIMDTISGTDTILEKYDMKEPFTIVFPSDPTLKRHALLMNADNSGPKTINLLKEFWTVTEKEVALSCAWWNVHGHFKDKNNNNQTFGRDMNWSYLHFKSHVDDVLYNEIDKLFQAHDKKERGGPLFFKLLTDVLLVSNEQSLAALESTITKYNIAVDGKDDLPESIKILHAVSTTIQAMRGDGKKSPLPDKYVVDIIKVLKTTSVDEFNKKMAEFHSNLDLLRLMEDKETINTPTMLSKTFLFANKVYKELFDDGVWQECVLQKAKSTFSAKVLVFWKNRCWNCKKSGCSKPRCKIPIDEARCERNRQEWMKETKANGGFTKTNGTGTSPKPFAWRPPEADEDNKRVIYGKPHTWNGKSSWIEDATPSSGLEDTPAGTNLAGNSTDIPTQVPTKAPTETQKQDDATAMTSDSKFSQEQHNEIRRIQANMQNLGASLASIMRE